MTNVILETIAQAVEDYGHLLRTEEDVFLDPISREEEAAYRDAAEFIRRFEVPTSVDPEGCCR